MAKKSFSTRLPWYRAEFDLEGLGFGALALVLAIILGGLHWILSFIVILIFFAILFASRDADRTSPEGEDIVLAPCDGVVESISPVSPPRELRWDTLEVQRIRISSSPFSVNGIRAAMTGKVDSFLVEPGAPSSLARDPDDSDLKEAFLLTTDEKHAVGLRVATGGLGPRLDIELETGDGVRAGRKIGVRRLGGWCDVFVPGAASLSLKPGMTVVGGETILCNLAALDASYDQSPRKATVVTEDAIPSPEVLPETSDGKVEPSDDSTPSEDPKSDLPDPEVMPEEVIEDSSSKEKKSDRKA